MLELERQNVLVLGLGASGRSVANFCAARGARVVAADERCAEEIGELAELDSLVERRLGGSFPDPAGFDLIVPSPGVPAKRYRTGSARVWGDIELSYRALAVPIVAITGTNGKSTTARLTEAMLRAAGFRARAAGNLGHPALELVGAPLDIAVLEVSSFQLETIDEFRPSVAVILNITPDHLDRHGSFEAYVAAKARILARQRGDDVAVLNFGDSAVRELASAARGRVLPFCTAGPLERGAWLDAGSAVLRDDDHPARRASLDGLRLVGLHNRENVLAALAASVAAGAEPGKAVSALATFDGLPHRAEALEEISGVCFVNDSKATNPGAALRSLCGFTMPIVWIAGGRDKGLDFGELADAAVDRVRVAVLIGEATAKLEAALRDKVEVQRADSIEAAVTAAGRIAEPGDIVLLAPACASQDQFRDFEERGERFRAAVAALAAGEATQ